MSPYCPCCGAPVRGLSPQDAAKTLPPTLALIVRFLATRPGLYVPAEEIAAAVWSGDPNGGPENATSSIGNAIQYGRPKLRRVGLDIVGRVGASGGRKLVQLEDAR